MEGQYGTLHVDTNGDYRYTRNAETPGGVEDKFTYTLIDGDGDIVTAVLTIGIVNTTPTGGRSFATVDDDGLTGPPAGNPG